MNASPKVTPEILDALAELQADETAALYIDAIARVNRWLLTYMEEINDPAEEVAAQVLTLMDLADTLKVLGNNPDPL